MAGGKRLSTKAAKLPKAPLVEVVFEMHWQLPSLGKGSPPMLASDPGLLPTIDSLTKKLIKKKFRHFKDMMQPGEFVIANSIARRYYPSEDVNFPLIQIGPGIFATNLGNDYDWTTFKSQVLEAAKSLLESYPKMPSFPFKPNFLELRYVSVFGAPLIDSANFLEFMNSKTNMNLTIPKILEEKKLFDKKESVEGRLVIMRNIANRKSSKVTLDVASVMQANGNRAVRLETKVTSTDAGVPKYRGPKQFLSDLGKWLGSSYSITSPLFEDFTKPELMELFEAES